MLNNASYVWSQNIQVLMRDGHDVSPRPGSKYTGNTRELIGFSSRIDMNKPIVRQEPRKLDFCFMFAEAVWILSGDDRVETIARYMPRMKDFSDDGQTFFGAYGPKVVEQLAYVVDTLCGDLSSRQAVINIWRENPPKTLDVPCTTTVQWLVRDGTLHCVDTMRSSDLWLGWPYDVFNFSMLSVFIITLLRETGIDLKLGSLTLNAGSQHLYERNWEAANRCIDYLNLRPTPDPLLSLASTFTPSGFIQYLTECRDSAFHLRKKL